MQEPKTIESLQKEIIEEFSFFEDWTDKYKFIIDLAKEAQPFPPNLKVEENKIKGCQSQVWLHAEFKDGKINFWGESDALIVKGLLTLLLRIYSGQTPDKILQSNPDFINTIGLSTHLSPTRSNGLAAMLKQIKIYALAFQSYEKN